MTAFLTVLRYLPLIIGSTGIVLFAAYGVATFPARGFSFVPITGVVVGALLVVSNLLELLPTRKSRRYYLLLLIVYTLGVLVMGLRLKADPSHYPQEASPLLSTERLSPCDTAINIVGFVPFGFLLLVTAIRWRRFATASISMIQTALICGLISLSIEVAQHFIATRASSIVDVGMNTTGALLGAAYGLLYSTVWSRQCAQGGAGTGNTQ